MSAIKMENKKPLREQIRLYLDAPENPIGIWINLVLLSLIILSLALFIAETYQLPEFFRTLFNYLDIVIIAIFTLEYCLRFWCADSKIMYFFSFFSLVDLLSILPLFLGFIDVRFLRIFRWIRILRIVRFIDFEIGFFEIKKIDQIIIARTLLVIFSVIIVYSGLIYQVEHPNNPEEFRNFFDALYFSVVTMTTVGFGDVIPLSEEGRVITLMMILTGVTLIPWQLGEFTKQLVKAIQQVKNHCHNCGLDIHDIDAKFCKNCGSKLEKL